MGGAAGVGGAVGGAVWWTGDEALVAVDVLPCRRLTPQPPSCLAHALPHSFTHSILPPVLIIIGMRV